MFTINNILAISSAYVNGSISEQLCRDYCPVHRNTLRYMITGSRTHPKMVKRNAIRSASLELMQILANLRSSEEPTRFGDDGHKFGKAVREKGYYPISGRWAAGAGLHQMALLYLPFASLPLQPHHYFGLFQTR